MIKIARDPEEQIGGHVLQWWNGAGAARVYDYVNVLCNPDLKTCTDPARFARQLAVVLNVTGLERQRLLKWVMAHAALSAAWFLEDGLRTKAHEELAVAQLARQALG